MYTKEEMMDDLILVGKEKSLGYLPLRTLLDLCSTTVEDMVQYANQNNLGFLLLKPSECNIGSGAVYLYDTKMLKTLFSDYHQIFIDAGVEISSPKQYIKYISSNTVDVSQFPKAYAAVGKTFNDRRFRNVSL